MHSDTAHVEVLSDTDEGINVTVERDPGDPATKVGVVFNFHQDRHFADRDWYFYVSAPRGDRMDVSIDLFLDQDMSIEAERTATAGQILTQDDHFRGTAEVRTGDVWAAHDLEATAEAPEGTRMFVSTRLWYPGFSDRTIGHEEFGIDGPGEADRSRTFMGRGEPSALAIQAGPPGEYTFWIDDQFYIHRGECLCIHKYRRVDLVAAPMPFD